MFRRRFLVHGSVTVVASAALGGCTGEESGDGTTVEDGETSPIEEHPSIEESLPNLPVHEHTDEYEASLEGGLRADVTDQTSLRAALEEAGIDVRHLERGREREHESDDEDVYERPALFLEYLDGDPSRGVLREMGFVTGVFTAFVSGTDDPARLQADVLDEDGAAFGTYTIPVRWARAFHGGELSLESYGALVFESLKTKRA